MNSSYTGSGVTTDKEDYSPGETATITATGFQQGETIEFQVLHIGGKSNDGNGHDAWQVTDGGPGDLDGEADGNIQTTWYVDPDDSLNSVFELTAVGQSSGIIATHQFVDDVAFPTALSSTYNPTTDILTVTVDWEWTDNDEKVVTAAVFADLDGDGNTPDVDSDPNTWSITNALPSPLVASDEFLGQISTSTIEGSTATGDDTDTGISSKALTYAGHPSDSPIVLFPYDLLHCNASATNSGPFNGGNPPVGNFTLTYTNVIVAPTSLCVILYDVHTDGGTVEPSGVMGMGGVAGSIDDFDGGHSPISATSSASGYPSKNTDNSKVDGVGGNNVSCEQLNSMPMIECPENNKLTTTATKN